MQMTMTVYIMSEGKHSFMILFCLRIPMKLTGNRVTCIESPTTYNITHSNAVNLGLRWSL